MRAEIEGRLSELFRSAPAVAELLRGTGKPLFHLGLSKAGHPKHPLYLPYRQTPQPWR